MAWEMQSHMFSYIEPSIVKYLEEDPTGLDHYKEDYNVTCQRDLVLKLTEAAQTYRTTINGAKEFYIDNEHATTIPWCDDDYYLTYWG